MFIIFKCSKIISYSQYKNSLLEYTTSTQYMKTDTQLTQTSVCQFSIIYKLLLYYYFYLGIWTNFIPLQTFFFFLLLVAIKGLLKLLFIVYVFKSLDHESIACQI